MKVIACIFIIAALEVTFALASAPGRGTTIGRWLGGEHGGRAVAVRLLLMGVAITTAFWLILSD